MLTSPSTSSPQAALIMQKLKLAPQPPPVGVIPFLNEAPGTQRVKLVYRKNKKALEELKPPTQMTKQEYEKIDACSWLEQLKLSMHAINQDLLRLIVMHHLVEEATVQLKRAKRKAKLMMDLMLQVALLEKHFIQRIMQQRLLITLLG